MIIVYFAFSVAQSQEGEIDSRSYFMLDERLQTENGMYVFMEQGHSYAFSFLVFWCVMQVWVSLDLNEFFPEQVQLLSSHPWQNLVVASHWDYELDTLFTFTILYDDVDSLLPFQ